MPSLKTFTKQLKSSTSSIYSWFLVGIIFTLPLNLFYVFTTDGAYVHGLLVDYLLPRIYLSDLIILVLFICWLIIERPHLKKIEFKKLSQPKFLLGLGLGLLLLGRQVLTSQLPAATYYSLKILMMGWLWFFLLQRPQVWQKKVVSFSLWLTLIFQAGLGLYQYWAQASLLPYHFLGETRLAQSVGLAKDSWWQTGRVLPYGTTAHPNLLAGVLVVLSLIWWQLNQTKKRAVRFLQLVTYFLVGATLVLTQSLSAWLSLLLGFNLLLWWPQLKKKKWLGWLGLCVWLLSPVLINLLSPLIKYQPSWQRRAQLNLAAYKMFWQKPWLGVGLNQFTAQVENFTTSLELVRFVQPVHHLGLLWLAETGLLGLAFLSWVWRNLKKHSQYLLPSLILLPLASLDHYLLTQQTGLLLLVLIFSGVLYKK